MSLLGAKSIFFLLPAVMDNHDVDVRIQRQKNFKLEFSFDITTEAFLSTSAIAVVLCCLQICSFTFSLLKDIHSYF